MKLKHKIIIFTAGTAVVLAAVLALIILPAIRDIRKLSQEIYEQRLDLEKKYLKGQLIQKLRRDYERIEPQIFKLSKPYLREGDELKFITDLEKIATQYNLEQQLELELEKQKIEKNKKIIPLKTGLGGNFISVAEYLSDLEKLDYYININSLTITRGADKKSSIPNFPAKELVAPSGDVNALIIAKTYWQDGNE